METNEQGLTKEEKIMFGILGVILIIAVGVLIINSFSEKGKELEDNKTPITETNGQKDDIVDDTNNEIVEDLIEETDTIEEYLPIVNYTSSNTATKPEELPSPEPTPEVPSVINWNFKNTMITEAYSNDIITIDKEVVLEDGTFAIAEILIQKQNGDKWEEVTITNDTFTVSRGLYKYIYSYSSSTKELLLTVKEHLDYEHLKLLTIIDNIDETSDITREQFTNLNNLLANSAFDEINLSNLTINNYDSKYTLLPLVLTLKEDISTKEITTDRTDITLSKEQKNWYQELTPNSILLWLDLNTYDVTNNKINIIIDGTSYELELNVTINVVVETPGEGDSELESETQGEKTEVEEETETETEEPTEENTTEEDEEEPVDNDTEEEPGDEFKPTPDEEDNEQERPVLETETDNPNPVEEETPSQDVEEPPLITEEQPDNTSNIES